MQGKIFRGAVGLRLLQENREREDRPRVQDLGRPPPLVIDS